MIKRMHKRGQFAQDNVGSLVIVFLVILVIGLGIYYIYDYVSTTTGTFNPEEFDLFVNACKASYSSGFVETYCRYQELADGNYINCEDGRVQTRLMQEVDGFTPPLPCTETPPLYCQNKIKKVGVFTINGADYTSTATTDAENPFSCV